MPNLDHPHGFRAVRMLNGGKIPTHNYTVSATTAVYEGDLLTLKAGGRVRATASTAGTTHGYKIVGVAAHYTAAGNDVAVYDDPFTIFAIQSDGATDPGSSTALAKVGANAAMIAGTANTTSKLSAHEVDYSSLTTAVNHWLKVMGYENRHTNDQTLSHADMEVMLNYHFWTKAGRGTGGGPVI